MSLLLGFLPSRQSGKCAQGVTRQQDGPRRGRGGYARRRAPTGALAALIVFCGAMHAQEMDRLAADFAADLQKALSELSAARQQVEAERLPLAREVAELEQRLAARRTEYEKAQRFQENQLVELNALKAEARQRGEEVKYIESLLSEYTRAFRGRLSFVEEPLYESLFASLARVESSVDTAPAGRFNQRSQLMEAALGRAESALGGELLDGRAIDRQGRVQVGRVALVGPIGIYANSSGDLVGVLQQELNKAEPTVVPAETRHRDAVRALVATGNGTLLLDATLGNAFKLAALKDPLYEKIAKGGVAMIPLIALGVAALLVAVAKWIQLGRLRPATEADLETVLGRIREGELDKAKAHARAMPGPAGDLLAAIIDNLDETKEHLEEVAYQKILGARTRLERGLQFLALTATAGPLMGLLGTVTGMIATFKLISSFGSGDPRLLAAGISEALICTATGMLIAIPALLFHSFLSWRAKGIVGSMEQLAVGFINGVPDQDKSPMPFARQTLTSLDVK